MIKSQKLFSNMANFKSFHPDGKVIKFSDVSDSGDGVLAGDGLMMCLESRNYNAICVSIEEDGTILLVNSKTFQIEPPNQSD